jgi:hypothetical protein
MLFAGGGAITMIVASLSTSIDAQSQADSVHVCAAAEGVLRLAQGPTCPAGQTSLYLATASAPDSKDDKKPSDNLAALQRRLDELEKRVSELEQMANQGELGSRVVAPFNVVDRSGRTIFQVERDYVRLYNGSSQLVAQIYASGGGGAFYGQTPGGDLNAAIGAASQFGGVMIGQGRQYRIQLGGQPGNRVSLKVFTGGGQLVAGIGEDTQGQGLAVVADKAGTYKAALQVASDGKGQVGVQNTARIGVAELSEGANGGGKLTIWGADGTAMVEAGVTAQGIGVVRTGPNFFKPGMGVLGLPGSYIVGKQ